MPAYEKSTIRIQVKGTTVMAVYDVVDGVVFLASADFGDAQAALQGDAPEHVAAALLRALAESAMDRGGDPFMRDGDQSQPGS